MATANIGMERLVREPLVGTVLFIIIIIIIVWLLLKCYELPARDYRSKGDVLFIVSKCEFGMGIFKLFLLWTSEFTFDVFLTSFFLHISVHVGVLSFIRSDTVLFFQVR